MEFISDSIKIIIKEGLKSLYVDLNPFDLEYLNKYMIKIIEMLYYQYNLNKDDFEYQLLQNDYKDIKWISTFLLPYLNANPSELRSFNELYTKKTTEIGETIDINKIEPEYKFTNLQYGRCKREIESGIIKCSEIPFSYEHLDQNYYLFLKTILISSNKLYVNWLNIIPLTLNDIDSDKTYQNTLNLFSSNKISELDIIKFASVEPSSLSNDNKTLIGSLYVGDIYNTIRVYLYEEIKKIKLLIFDVVIFPSQEKVNSTSVLNDLFNDGDKYLLTDALNNIEWISQPEKNQKTFISIWNNILNSYFKNIKLSAKSNNDYYSISELSLKSLLKGIAINFDERFGRKKKIIDSGYITLKNTIIKDDNSDDEDDDDDDFGKKGVYNFEKLNECLSSIKPEFIYDFFRDILQQFKITYYSHKLLKEDKKSFLESETKTITIKNIYNFAKSLSSYVKIDANGNKKYTQYNKNWCSLEADEKQVILDRLNDKISNSMEWFNIGRYIKSLLDAGFKFIDEKVTSIENINKNIYTLIREDLIKIIYEILIFKGVLSKFVPDKTVTDDNFTEGKKINELITPKYFVKSNKYATFSYYYLTELPYYLSGNLFDVLSNNSWYTMQAMQWVSQLGFCHHYLNNRVSYVTGATGVGKSTHVPKLYLYFLKAIDYKSIGKVVCTQPRKTPTEKNSGEVSAQLGLPIFEINEKGELELNEFGEKTALYDYYSVQMQHQDRKHVKNVQQLVLKFITDGSLLQEFRETLPLCTKMSYDKKRATMENLYDVIIIDEAHEHNKNMDLLLTLLKIFGYYNPFLRVVILSATIDEDEPNYRRYYRAINDNLKYPYDLWIRDNKLDRINIDRRFHISAPGTGTRFQVKEYYKDNYDIITLIQELIKTVKGDILVFQPGEADIINLIEELNSIIPDNWIALPFYSTMSAEKRSFIEDIDKTFPTLKINKYDDFNKVKSLQEGKGNYTNFILIATNIAEASITIRRLYYVVDTGTRKINYYDYKRRNDKLLLKTIGETSRVQRKGRVGRTGEGEAYFLYKKDKTSEKNPAEISIANISNDIYFRLRNNTNEEKFTLEKYYDSIKDMFETSIGKYTYVGNKIQNDYDFKEYMPDFYESGFNMDDLMDNMGRFYIVHPEEIFLKRNIFGTIVELINDDPDIPNIKFSDKKRGVIKSDKMESFIEDFITTNFLNNNNKTELGINISEILEKFKFDSINYAKTLTYSILLGSSEKMLMGITLLNILRGDIINFFSRDKENDTPTMKNVINNNLTSDIEVLIDICEKLFKYIAKTSEILNLDYVINQLKVYGDVFEYKGVNVNVDDILSVYKSNKEYEDDNLPREDIVDYAINLIKNTINNSQNRNHIDNFCKLYNIDTNILIKFIPSYLKLKDIISTLYNQDKRGKSFDMFLTEYKLKFEDKYQEFDKLKLAFVLTQPYNIIYSITGTDSFLSIYYPVAENIVNLGKTKIFVNNKKKYINTLLFNSMYTKGYCYFDNYNSNRDMITNIIQIDKKYINLFKNIYNKDRIKEILQTYKSKIDKYIKKAKDSLEYKAPLPKDYTIISNVYTSYNNLFIDIDSIS